MTEEMIARLFSAGVTALMVLLILGIHVAVRKEKGRYAPVYPVIFLPMLLAGFPLLMLVMPNQTALLGMVALHMVISAVIYQLLMLLLTPLLRRRLSAEGCAVLWTLPNLLLYWVFVMRRLPFQMEHRVILLLPRRLFRGLLLLWTVGFLAVVIRRTVSHLRFRRSLLQGAVQAGPRETELLKETRGELKAKNSAVSPKLRLLRSPSADSPLSVGLLRQTTCLILPEKDYTDEELHLIFRHELIHLLHNDNLLKLTLTLVCAAGWFLPSLWAGMGKAAEELELCCDELATEGMDGEERRRYADLLLQNAGSSRGFTTCLSASASGLRYRLTRILRPEKRRFGVLPAAALSAIFAFSFGIFGFALEAGTFRSEILERDGETWYVSQVTSWNMPSDLEASTDPAVCAAAEELLGEQQLDETPDRVFSISEQLGVIHLTCGDRKAIAVVYPQGVIFYPDAERSRSVTYTFRTPPDPDPLFAAASAGAD